MLIFTWCDKVGLGNTSFHSEGVSLSIVKKLQMCPG